MWKVSQQVQSKDKNLEAYLLASLIEKIGVIFHTLKMTPILCFIHLFFIQVLKDFIKNKQNLPTVITYLDLSIA